jgi:tetratricopeptide (TPR) repeat protein
MVLNNLGNVAALQEDYQTAGSLYEQSLALERELGDKRGVALSLNAAGSMAHILGDYQTARSLYEEGLAMFQELGDKLGVAISLNTMGSLAYMQGDHQTAGSLYRQGLALVREIDDKSGIAVSLTGLGAIEVGAAEGAGTGNLDGIQAAQRGARLLGASEALLESIGAVQEPVDRVLYTQGIASARLQLGDEPFEKARQEGRAMSAEAATEYALQHSGGTRTYAPPRTQVYEVQTERQRQVDELHIEINQAKKARQVEAITATEYFIELQARAKALLLERTEREAKNRSSAKL